MLNAIRARIYPTDDQERFLWGQFGAVRFC